MLLIRLQQGQAHLKQQVWIYLENKSSKRKDSNCFDVSPLNGELFQYFENDYAFVSQHGITPSFPY